MSELSTEHIHKTSHRGIIDRTSLQKRVMSELSIEHIDRKEPWGKYRANFLRLMFY